MAPLTPLVGTRVLDLSSNLPGPLLTRILADLGAEVIKVEPLTGEGLRHMPPHNGSTGSIFGGLHADKDSVAVDLKKPEGVALVLRMAAQSDVFVEAFRPGKLAALGLGADDLHRVNPRLVVCSLTGYGQTGPMADRAGHDINYLAHSGVLGLFGPADRPPQVPGVQVADVGGGSLPAAVGVLAALMERETTGRGRHLDISLARGSAAFGTVAFSGGADQERGAGMLTGGAPCYRCFQTSDGRLLALGALEPRFFTRFCELADREDLAHMGLTWGEDAHGAIDALTELIGSQTAQHWIDLCAGHDVCLSLVRTPHEAMEDPDMKSVIRQVDGFTVVTTHLGAPAPSPTRPPSALGADSPAVTRRLALETELVQQAVEAGALLWPGEDKP